MKRFLNVFYILMFLVIAASVSAAASFTMSDVSFGSSEQARGQDVSSTVTLINDGTDPLIINLSSRLASSYNARFSQSVVSLPAGARSDVTMTIHIPLSQNSGTSTVTGALVATSNVAGVSRTSNVVISAVSELEISKVTIELNNDGDEHSLKRSGTYDDELKSDTPITIRIFARNNFDSADDIEINDITVDVRSTGDLDLDESDDLTDLSYGEKDDVKFSTKIPSDAEDGDNYNLQIKVSGRDENGALHTNTFNTELEVKRESHDITIKRATISPQTVTCSGRVTVSATLENNGRYDEDKVHLLIENADLGLSQRFYEMSLDRDDELDKSYSFTVSNKTASGQYDIVLTSFYDADSESDTQIVTLNVESCPVNTNNNNNAGNTNTGTNTNTNTNQPNVQPVVPSNGATVAYGSSTFADSPLYVVLLIAGIAVLLVILIVLLVKFVF